MWKTDYLANKKDVISELVTSKQDHKFPWMTC